MKLLLRTSLLAGIAAALTLPVMAQDVEPQPVLEDDAVPVSAPASEALTLPPAPRYPAVMQWPAAHARELLTLIESIGAEGLDPADYRPGALRAAIETGAGPELDAIASQMFTWLVEDLRDGRTPMEARKQWFVVDPDPDLMPTGRLMTEALATGDVAAALVSVLPTHPDYAALRDELAATPASNRQRRMLIRANMDRWRWLQRDLGGQYLLTNVPEFQLRLTVNNNIIRTYRTIVGNPRTPTPQLAETVEGVIFNPNWTVPQSIVKGEGLGARVLGNPTWARANGYTATRGTNGYISVVQGSGPGNSLGQMKLDMPNPHAIFLHDTPARGLFANANRALSHGCVRVERALELAMTIAILGQGASRDEAVAISTSGDYTRVPVKKSMPVYITYFTMARDIDGELKTFNDIYGRDAPVLASFNAPRVGNRARVTSEEVKEIVDDLQTS
jgi:L,D-transpeptidase YcbB